MSQNKSYRVLSLDGGGMRGLYAASVLQSLVNRFSRPDSRNKDIGKALWCFGLHYQTSIIKAGRDYLPAFIKVLNEKLFLLFSTFSAF